MLLWRQEWLIYGSCGWQRLGYSTHVRVSMPCSLNRTYRLQVSVSLEISSSLMSSSQWHRWHCRTRLGIREQSVVKHVWLHTFSWDNLQGLKTQSQIRGNIKLEWGHIRVNTFSQRVISHSFCGLLCDAVSNSSMSHDGWGNGKDLEGTGPGLIEVLTWHLLGVTEEKYQKLHSG
jgi:hypothetical protein